MASLICKCGFRLSNTLVPNNIQYYVYSDPEWHKMLEKDTIATLDLPHPKNDVWKCPNCDRIYVFSDDGSIKKTYKPEDD